MDEWIQKCLKETYIRRVSESELSSLTAHYSGRRCGSPQSEKDPGAAAAPAHRILGIASLNAWYDEGVALDWSALHSRLAKQDCASTPGFVEKKNEEAGRAATAAAASVAISSYRAMEGLDLTDAIRTLNQYGEEQLRAFGEDHCVITVLEIDAPWKLQPLEQQASLLSSFSAVALHPEERPNTTPQKNSAGAGDDDGLCRPLHQMNSSGNALLAALDIYAFTRGPPGLMPVVRDVHLLLTSLETQLRQQQIRVCRFLSSLVLFEGDTTALLHHTAAVHKAVKSAGFTINMHRSALGPTPVFRVGSSTAASGPQSSLMTWTPLLLKTIQQDSDAMVFSVDLFLQWLQDAYAWRCLPPIKVFPSGSSRNTLAEEESALHQRRLSLFLKFFNTMIHPLLRTRLQFPALADIVELEFDDFTTQVGEHLKRKRSLSGPQKWTILDLRITLCLAGAYAVSPVALFITASCME